MRALNGLHGEVDLRAVMAADDPEAEGDRVYALVEQRAERMEIAEGLAHFLAVDHDPFVMEPIVHEFFACSAF